MAEICQADYWYYTDAIRSQFMADEMANEMYYSYSGVSVNVQDLAPSCAGALFGKLKSISRIFMKFSFIPNISCDHFFKAQLQF